MNRHLRPWIVIEMGAWVLNKNAVETAGDKQMENCRRRMARYDASEDLEALIMEMEVVAK